VACFFAGYFSSDWTALTMDVDVMPYFSISSRG
jgi:hypothetical protein